MDIHYKETETSHPDNCFKAQSQVFYRTTYGKVNVVFLRGNLLLVFLRKFMFFSESQVLGKKNSRNWGSGRE